MERTRSRQYYHIKLNVPSLDFCFLQQKLKGRNILLVSAEDINSLFQGCSLREAFRGHSSWFTNQTCNYVYAAQIPIWVCRATGGGFGRNSAAGKTIWSSGGLLFAAAKGGGRLSWKVRLEWLQMCDRPCAGQQSTNDKLQCASVAITHPVFFFFLGLVMKNRVSSQHFQILCKRATQQLGTLPKHERWMVGICRVLRKLRALLMLSLCWL